MKQRGVKYKIAVAVMLSVAIIAMTGISTLAEDLSTWEMIKQRGSVRMGVTESKPYFTKNPSTGEWSGFLIPLAQEIADAMGVEAELVETTWGNAVAALQAGQIDMMPGLEIFPKRALAIDYTMSPMGYIAYTVLLRDENMVVDTWQDLNHAQIKIAVGMGFSYDMFATKRMPDATIQRYPVQTEADASFLAGRSDVLINDHMAQSLLQQTIGMGQIVIPKPVQYSRIVIGVRKEPDTTWRDFLNLCSIHYYEFGKVQEWYEEALQIIGIDPKTVPSIMKELWE